MADEKTVKRQIQRSPGYPSVDLKTAIEQVRTLKEYAGAGRPIPVHVALQRWDYSPKSGAGLQMLAALIKYGLLEDEGSKSQRVVKVTGRANVILVEKPESSRRREAIKAAATSPTLLREIQDLWPHGLPSDNDLRSWLILEKEFNEKAVPAVLKVVKSTFDYATLDAGPEKQDTDGDKPSSVLRTPPVGSGDKQELERHLSAGAGQIEAGITLFGDGDVRLVVPKYVSEENKPLLNAWIQAMVKRVTSKPDTEPNNESQDD